MGVAEFLSLGYGGLVSFYGGTCVFMNSRVASIVKGD